MKKWLQNLSSAVIATLLAVTLNGRAYADTPAEDPPVEIQDPAPAELTQVPVGEVLPEVAVQSAPVEPAAEPLTPAAVPEEPVTVPPAAVTPAAEEEPPAATLEAPAESPEKLPAAAPEAQPDQPELPAEENPAPAAVKEVTPSEIGDTPATVQDNTEVSLLPETPSLTALTALRTLQTAPQPKAANALPAAAPENTDAGNGTESPSGSTEPGENTGNAGTASAQGVRQGEDGSYILSSCSAESLTAEGDITIQAAGLNRLSSISVNGNVNLVGTGILLVDKIEIAEGCSFNLQTNTNIYADNSGSVAVFLKQEDGTYRLINGPSVKGLLDEAYSIPENVALVVPEGSTLVMQSLAVAEATVDETSSIGYSTIGEAEAQQAAESGFSEEGLGPSVEFKSSAPTLTIPQTAKLIVEKAASIIMKCVYTLNDGKQYSPKLNIGGELVLEGEITGGITELSSEDAISGTGQFSNATVNVTADQTAIQASESIVKLLSGAETDKLSLSGDCTVEHDDGAGIGELALSGNADVTVKSFDQGTLNIGTITGSGTVNEGCYNFSLDEDPLGKVGLTVNLSSPGVMVTGAGGGSEKVFTSGPERQLLEVNITNAGREGNNCIIPVLSVGLHSEKALDGSLSYTIGVPDLLKTPDYFQIPASGTGIPSETVTELLGSYSWIEVYYRDSVSNTVKMLKVEPEQKDSPIMISAETICLIRRVQSFPTTPNGGGGGVVTATNMAYTGSGILGGSGAGSLQGGSARSILTGTGITKPAENENTNSNTGDHGNGNSNTNTGDQDNETNGNNTNQTGTDDGKTKPVSLVAQVTGDAQQQAPVWTETSPGGQGSEYVVLALEGEKTLEDLGGTANVSMKYTPPAEYAGKQLYVVFRNEDGTLTAIRASWSKVTGLLRFLTDRLGTFMVVGFDFDGLEFSEEFYAALAQLPGLENLVFAEYSPV